MGCTVTMETQSDGEDARPRDGSSAATSPVCSLNLSGRMRMTWRAPSSSASPGAPSDSCWICRKGWLHGNRRDMATLSA